MTSSFDSILTIDELAAYLKIPKATLYKLAQESKIPGQKVGRHWRFRKETIDRWLDQEAISCGTKPGKRRGRRRGKQG